jgi:hypothetical protein
MIDTSGLELIVPLAVVSAFISTSLSTWSRRKRVLEESRVRAAQGAPQFPVHIVSTFPMEMRGDLSFVSAHQPSMITAIIGQWSLESGYTATPSSGCTIAYKRGSEWRALSSFDLRDVPSEVAIWITTTAAGTAEVRCVMTYHTAAHFVAEDDIEQASTEFSQLVESLRPASILKSHPQ